MNWVVFWGGSDLLFSYILFRRMFLIDTFFILKLTLLLGRVLFSVSWCIFIDFIFVVMFTGVKVIIMFGRRMFVFIRFIGTVLMFGLRGRRL